MRIKILVLLTVLLLGILFSPLSQFNQTLANEDNGIVSVFRYLNNLRGSTHVYIADPTLRQAMDSNIGVNGRWNGLFRNEGEVFRALEHKESCPGGSKPVHRFLNTQTGDTHFYTINESDFQTVINNSKAGGVWEGAFSYERVSFCAFEEQKEDTIPVARFLNKAQGQSVHFYAAGKNSINLMKSRSESGGIWDDVFDYEKIAFYAYESPKILKDSTLDEKSDLLEDRSDEVFEGEYVYHTIRGNKDEPWFSDEGIRVKAFRYNGTCQGESAPVHRFINRNSPGSFRYEIDPVKVALTKQRTDEYKFDKIVFCAFPLGVTQRPGLVLIGRFEYKPEYSLSQQLEGEYDFYLSDRSEINQTEALIRQTGSEMSKKFQFDKEAFFVIGLETDLKNLESEWEIYDEDNLDFETSTLQDDPFIARKELKGQLIDFVTFETTAENSGVDNRSTQMNALCIDKVTQERLPEPAKEESINFGNGTSVYVHLCLNEAPTLRETPIQERFKIKSEEGKTFVVNVYSRDDIYQENGGWIEAEAIYYEEYNLPNSPKSPDTKFKHVSLRWSGPKDYYTGDSPNYSTAGREFFKLFVYEFKISF